ncbi:MAG TPA: histidinol-phosphate transaminase [Candidatus Saccharimonadales bacterium]|nr:histidinol-phosphate transaminase [Candidatus Saccharimonadales bacterium]
MRHRPPPPREYLAHLPRYIAGTEAVATAGLPNYKLSSNESPYPVLEPLVQALAESARRANRYPPSGRALAEQLAQAHSLAPEQVAVAGGSLELLRDLLTAYAGFDREVVLGWRSYEAYPILVQSLGARGVRVPLLDHRVDLPAVLAAVSTNTRVILLANPNNPTGTTVEKGDLEYFVHQLPQDCLLVLDEAYCEYSSSDLAAAGIGLAEKFANVAVLRTFSKAYALAGMRVGWCVADPEIVENISRVALPFTLTATAQAGALAALELEPQLMAQVGKTVAERERVQAALDRAGYTVPRSQANFIWLPLGAQSLGFAGRCGSAGISIRCFADEGVRVTIGTPAENDRFLEIASSDQTRKFGQRVV